MIQRNDIVIALFGRHGDLIFGGRIFMQHDFRYVDKYTVKVLKMEVIEAQDTIILQEILTPFSITLDVLLKLCDLPVVLLDLFKIDLFPLQNFIIYNTHLCRGRFQFRVTETVAPTSSRSAMS